MTTRLDLRTTVLAMACAITAACATPVFNDTGNLSAVVASDVQQSPDRYAGTEVIWGGRIIKVENREQTTEVEIVAYPLDRDQQPQPDSPTVGRFMLVLPGFVEPFDYPAGRHLSVRGVIDGARLGHVDEHDYLYPLLRAKEVTVWPWGFMFDKRPRVSVGVGVRIH